MNNIDIAYSLMDLFEQNNEKIYLVGGSVRDYLLFNDFSDFDFATTATPDKVLYILHIIIKDKFPLKYGTIKTTYMGKNIEITTLRKESKYNDHRRPNSVEFIKDLSIDSDRRDLTINALYLDKYGIKDYHNGLKDLKNKRLRFIGKSLSRINEDSLRILRIIRFSLSLKFHIHKTTKKLLIKYSYLLNYVSKDKINSEIEKMLKNNTKEEINKAFIEYNIDLHI